MILKIIEPIRIRIIHFSKQSLMLHEVYYWKAITYRGTIFCCIWIYFVLNIYSLALSRNVHGSIMLLKLIVKESKKASSEQRLSHGYCEMSFFKNDIWTSKIKFRFPANLLLTHFMPLVSFWPLENRKPLVFLCFQGV